MINAKNVPGYGLCAFAAVAEGLGRDASEAPEVRKEMAAEVESRLAWYTEHVPTLIQDRTIKDIQAILQCTALRTNRRLWYPLPGGASIVANTYKRPVIIYQKLNGGCRTFFPFFGPFEANSKPIVLGFLNGNHCVHLELNICPELPIPFRMPEADKLYEDPEWILMYSVNIQAFRVQKRLDDKPYAGGVLVTVPCNTDSE